MAKNHDQKNNNKVKSKKNSTDENKENKKPEKSLEMKILITLGVIVSCVICVYLMNYFFVKKSYIKINISTDKRVDNIIVNGEEKSILTQKYVSDLNYSMRYDMDAFKVTKYKKQDMFKYLKAEKVLVIVEMGTIPSNCVTPGEEVNNSCLMIIDDYTQIYYVKEKNLTFKITVKTPKGSNYTEDIKSRINLMLNSFTVS